MRVAPYAGTNLQSSGIHLIIHSSSRARLARLTRPNSISAWTKGRRGRKGQSSEKAQPRAPTSLSSARVPQISRFQGSPPEGRTGATGARRDKRAGSGGSLGWSSETYRRRCAGRRPSCRPCPCLRRRLRPAPAPPPPLKLNRASLLPRVLNAILSTGPPLSRLSRYRQRPDSRLIRGLGKLREKFRFV